MSQQSDQAKWDALAEMLGAKVSQTEGPPKPRPETKVVPRVHLDLPPPPRKKADWGSLAVDLGAEAPVENHPERAASPAPPEARSAEPREERPSADCLAPPPRRERQEERERARHEVARERRTSEAISSARNAEHETLSSEVAAEDLAATPRADSERRPPRRRRRRGPRQKEEGGGARPRHHDASADAAEPLEDDEPVVADGGERREPNGGGKRAGHKSVPSWAEAISIMIDANLATRSTRRRSGPNGGRMRGRRGGKRS